MTTPDPLEDTVDLIPVARFSEAFFASPSKRFLVKFGASSHTGNVRSANEDHYAVVRRRRTSELILTDLSPSDLVLGDDSSYALIVADGMGGARFGEFASRLALRRMFELAQQATSWVMKFTDMEVQQIRERVDAYVRKIQATLREYTEADPALAGMGTTWTSAHLLLPHVLIVHIGDSRAYLLHEGELCQITHDETLAQAFIDTGMEPKDVRRFGHILLNNFGSDTDKVTAQVHQLQMSVGDQLLLCTDGLSDMIADEDIATILLHDTPPQVTCDELIIEALKNGGKDNVTVVVATVVSEDRSATSSAVDA